MIRSLLWMTFTAVLAATSLFFYCTHPSDPTKKDDNARIEVLSDSSVTVVDNEAVLKLSLLLPHLMDSIVVNFGDGTSKTINPAENDTLVTIKHTFLTDGQKTITATAYTRTVSKTSEYKITVVVPARLQSNKSVSSNGAPAEGLPISLSVTATGTQPILYTWYKDGEALPQSDNATFVIQKVQESDQGEYFCIVSNSYGNDTSLTYHLQFGQQLAPVIQNNRVTLESGVMELDATFLLYIVATGSPEFAFQWYRNGEEIAGENSDTLEFPLLAPGDTGSYFCVVSNAFGADTCEPYIIRLNQIQKPVILNDKQIQTTGTAEIDSAYCMEIETAGEPTELYQWYKNGEIIEGKASASLCFPAVQLSDSGRYYCIVSTSAGSDTSEPYTLSVALRTYQITITCGPHGSMTPSSSTGKISVAEGEDKEFVFTPDPGYHITEVRIDGTPDTTAVREKRVVFSEVVENHTLEVSFAINTYTVSLTKVGTGRITTTPLIDGPVAHGTQITLTADTIFGNYFAGWSGDTAANTESLTFIVTEDRAITATFAQIGRYAISITVDSGNGTITKTPDQEDYMEGDRVVLRAMPGSGCLFNKKWYGDTTATGDSLVLIINKNYAISASFDRKSYTIYASAGAGGLITPSDSVRVLHGDDTTFVITPLVGHSISEVLVDGVIDAAAKSARQKTFTDVSANHSIQVSFARKRYSLSASISTDYGTVSGSILKDPDAVLYDSGTTVTLYAPEDSRYEFIEWSGGVSGTSPVNEIVMDGNKQIIAHYVIKKCTLTVTVSPEQGGSVSLLPATGPYNLNTSVGVSASPAEGYSFACWTGDLSGTKSDTAITMDGNKNIIAHFSMDSPRIISQPKDTTVISGKPASFAVTTTGLELSYEWQKNGLKVSGATNAIYYIDSLRVCDDKSKIRCIISNSSGNDTSAVVNLLILPSGMKLIPAKQDSSFKMGQAGIADTVHSVYFTYNFWIDSTEVTQVDFVSMMHFNPSYFSTVPNGPVEQVTWYDAALFCNVRSKREGLDTVYIYLTKNYSGNNCVGFNGMNINYNSNGFRLPTEAEWEYSCRAGTKTEYYWGLQSIEEYAWYKDNSNSTTHSVGQKRPNNYGLYDMNGNVLEWCNDYKVGDYISAVQVDPFGANTGSFRALRGGSWYLRAVNNSSCIRTSGSPGSIMSTHGFRVVLPVQNESQN